MQANKGKLGSNPLADNVLRQVVGEEENNKFAGTSSNRHDLIEALFARLKGLQGIKSVTYRFPVEEITEFDQMVLDLQKALGGKRVSKNDVIRSGVNLLIEDWQRHGKNGLVFNLLKKLGR